MWKWFLILRFIWKYDLRFIYITHKSCAFSTILFLLLMAKIYILSCLYPQIHFLRKEWCFPLYREVICPSTMNWTNWYNNNLFTELFVIQPIQHFYTHSANICIYMFMNSSNLSRYKHGKHKVMKHPLNMHSK